MVKLKHMKISLKVAAKINLSLNIKGIYADGYHEIESVMASINIFDRITIVDNPSGLVRCYMNGKVCNENNTALKAANLIKENFKTRGVTINIKKGIPYSAGLGGSSADAAGIIFGMNKMFSLGDIKDLEKLAINIGSDVPYMLHGGTKKVSGRGDKIEGFDNLEYDLIVLKGKKGVATREVYAKYDDMHKGKVCSGSLFTNDLQASAISICPEILDNIEFLKNSKAKYALMSGSGSSVYGIFDDKNLQEEAFCKLKEKVNYCRKAKILNRGIFEVKND